jgi:hypothetical protein
MLSCGDDDLGIRGKLGSTGVRVSELMFIERVETTRGILLCDDMTEALSETIKEFPTSA